MKIEDSIGLLLPSPTDLNGPNLNLLGDRESKQSPTEDVYEGEFQSEMKKTSASYYVLGR